MQQDFGRRVMILEIRLETEVGEGILLYDTSKRIGIFDLDTLSDGVRRELLNSLIFLLEFIKTSDREVNQQQKKLWEED